MPVCASAGCCLPDFTFPTLKRSRHQPPAGPPRSCSVVRASLLPPGLGTLSLVIWSPATDFNQPESSTEMLTINRDGGFLKQTEFIVPIDRNLTCCTKPADLVRPDRTAATSITWTVCTSQRTTISNLDIFILTNKIFCSLSECSADGNNFLYWGRLKYVLAFHILEVSEENTIGVITCRPPTLCCWPVKTLTLPTHSSLTLTYGLTVRHLYESVFSPDRTLFVFFFRSHRKSIWKHS